MLACLKAQPVQGQDDMFRTSFASTHRQVRGLADVGHQQRGVDDADEGNLKDGAMIESISKSLQACCAFLASAAHVLHQIVRTMYPMKASLLDGAGKQGTHLNGVTIEVPKISEEGLSTCRRHTESDSHQLTSTSSPQRAMPIVPPCKPASGRTCEGQQSASKALPAGPAVPREVREQVVRRQGLQTRHRAHGWRVTHTWSAA